MLPTLSPRKATRSSARPPATGLPNGALLPLASLGDLGDLEVDLERLDDLPGRGRDPRCTDDRGDRGKDTADPLSIDADLAGRAEVHQIRDRRGIHRDRRGVESKPPRLVSGIGDLIAGLCSADCARRRGSLG